MILKIHYTGHNPKLLLLRKSLLQILLQIILLLQKTDVIVGFVNNNDTFLTKLALFL